MLRSLSTEELSVVAGGLYDGDDPDDGGGSGDWSWSDSVSFFDTGGGGSNGSGDYDAGDIVVTANLDDSSWATSSDNALGGFDLEAANGEGAGPLPFTLNPDGSIPTYTDPTTGDIVVTAAYNNNDYTEASVAVDAVITVSAGLSATAESKLLMALGAGGTALAGMHVDQIKAQVARAQRNAKNVYGYNLYNSLYGND